MTDFMVRLLRERVFTENRPEKLIEKVHYLGMKGRFNNEIQPHLMENSMKWNSRE